MPDDSYDVAILGGGLAGMTLALQLKGERPETSILITEQRKGAAPEAAFKVGESTVEMSAHYFANVVGMKDHMDAEHLEKAGLRFFFPAGDNTDITERVEWGATALPPVPSYQLDRGRFENALLVRNEEVGNHRIGGSRIKDVELDGENGHTVTISQEGRELSVKARWVVDATGRTQFLKRKLGLEKDVEHHINAAWFRLGGGIDIDRWSDDPEWHARMEGPGIRKLSTNHLMGQGYWVWLIPLGSGPISIGIVADPRFHPLEEINTFGAALDWLRRHEPQLAREVDGRQNQVQDFLSVEDFAYSCERVFSPDRWGMTGPAGVFADPFYSPGSDFIAQANTYITDLVVRDLAGEEIRRPALQLNAQYLTAFETAIRGTYTNHYQLFGNAEVMSAKILWEYATYWAIAALPFFQGKLTDPDFAKDIGAAARRPLVVGARLEEMFRDWHELGEREWRNAFISNRAFPGLWQLHLDLAESFDDDALRRRYEENADLLDAVAIVIFAAAVDQLPDASIDPDQTINPAGISLHPDRWEKDGLFNGEGLTLSDARSRTAGLEKMMLGQLVQAA